MKLSIVISERNDPFGCLITVRSIIEDLKNCKFNSEIIIVDNSDIKSKRNSLYDIFEPYINSNTVKIIEQSHQCLFSARDLGVQHSSGEYIFIVDSHCLMMKDSLSQMISFADKVDNLGILFGLMCYSSAHELDAFCDRDVERFTGVRFHQYDDYLNFFKIPLRSMPMVISRKVWDEIRGYYPLSTHKLSWGGGDFLLSLKPLLFGYDNWCLSTTGVVHLGPFNDGGFFTTSYLKTSSAQNPRFLGMLVSAYVIGGEELFNIRFNQMANRVDKEILNRISKRVPALAIEARRWIENNQKVTYTDIVNEFKFDQGKGADRIYTQDSSLFPEVLELESSSFEPCGYIPSRVRTRGMKLR